MKKFIVLFVVLFLTLPVMAQEEVTDKWDHGCDPDARPAMSDLIGEPAYSAVCTVFLKCLSEAPDVDAVQCEIPLYESFLGTCEEGDAQCELKSRLYTAAISVFDFPGPISIYDDVPKEYREMFIGTIKAYLRDGDAALVVGAFKTAAERLYYTYGVNSSMLLVPGIVFEYEGNTADALEAYTKALWEFETPFGYLLRAQLYASNGQTDLAAIDAFQLSNIVEQFASANDLSLRLSAEYPLDTTKLEDWFVYPVRHRNDNIGGTFEEDRSLQNPEPLQIGFYEGGHILLTLDEVDDALSIMVFQKTNENTFTYYDASQSVTITFDGDTAKLNRSYEGFESGGSAYSMLAKHDVPDPRPTTYPRCENGARWRLNIGSEGRAASNIDVYNPSFYTEPEGEEVGQFYTFEVVGGPVCLNDTTWWQVKLYGHGGKFWIEEAVGTPENGFTYNVIPQNRSTYQCPGAPPPNQNVGGHGLVIAVNSENNVYSQPSLQADPVGTIPLNGRFDVLDGPVCADSSFWWQVDFNGLWGWIVGGSGETYYIEPDL